jgi:hypothetical protein
MRFTEGAVTLNPYKIEPARVAGDITREELIAHVGGVFIVDVENYSNYLLIGFKNIATGNVMSLELSPDTRFNPMLLSWIMHNYVTVGFNSNNFDIPLIWLAYSDQNTELIKEASNAIIFQGMSPFDLQKEYKFKIHTTRHIDLIEVCPLRGSLKTYAARLHAPRIQDLPFDVSQPISREQAAIVKAYNVNDLDATQIIFSNLAEQLKLRDELSTQYNENLLSKSDPQVAEAIIAKEIQRITRVRPKPPKMSSQEKGYRYKIPGFISFRTPQLQQTLERIANAKYYIDENSGRLIVPEHIEKNPVRIGNATYTMGNGGLHSCEKTQSFKASEDYEIEDTDVSSYYPWIIINQNLFPKHLGPAFMQCYKDIVNRRMAAKERKDFAVSEGLKIAVNGVFGKLGSPYSIVYSPDLLIQVTVTGQLGLLMIIEAMELNGIRVISANTDGVVTYCERSKLATRAAIIKEWEQQTGFKTESTYYGHYYSRDVNNYIAIKKPNDKGQVFVKGKGACLNPWSGSQEIEKLAIFRFHKNPQATICIEAVTQHAIYGTPFKTTIEASRDVKEFVIVRNVTGGAHRNGDYIGKVIRWYYAKGYYGTLNYIKNNHVVPETEGAKPCQDMPASLPNDIDYAAYVKRAEKLATELNVYRAKLSLFD